MDKLTAFVAFVQSAETGSFVAAGRIASLTELQQQMLGPLPEAARIHIGKVLDALLALVAWARDPIGRPLVTLRVQVSVLSSSRWLISLTNSIVF